jgi:hypothetical protein
MRRLPCRAPKVRLPLDMVPVRGASGIADRRQRQEAADEAGVARCPRCRAPLVARMGCRGPYFHCACAESVSPHYDR